MYPEPIASHLTPQEESIERIVYARATAEIDHYVREYRKRFVDHFSSDKAAELFPEYNASEETRIANRAAVTKASHFVVDRAFLVRLRERDETRVAFVIGGPGAGKTTSSAGAIAEGNIVFDGSAVHAEHLIDEAAASGRIVTVQYVHRDPVDAFRGTLDRAMNSPAERGRVIPLRLHEQLHRGSAEAIERIAKKYATNHRVETSYLVNSSIAPPRIGSIEDVRRTRYSGLGELLQHVLDNERAAHRISQTVYDRVRQGPGAAATRQTHPAGHAESSGGETPGAPG